MDKAIHADQLEAIERVKQALADIRDGKMVILVDDEDRENEGDLCMAADQINPESVNFMALHGRGLICLALEESQVRRLQLPMMVLNNRSPMGTAFTVSIEAARGVSTGISAADRALTIKTAVNPQAKADDLISPGHIFPLCARPGGVLQRTGQTEGSVDLAKLAGRAPSAVICEIMNEDGTMARHQDLLRFSETHGLRMLSVADLVRYRLAHESLVEKIETADIKTKSGQQWQAHVFQSPSESRQFLALTLGKLSAEPTLVRVHTGSALTDIFGALCQGRLPAQDAVGRIEQEGCGVFLFLPTRMKLAEDLRLYQSERTQESLPTQSAAVLHEYGLGAQILAKLGLQQIRLLSNRPRKMAGLEAFGLKVVEQVSINAPSKV
ncbi:MAG: 3,4-dihydroxy-2-butanone-4-phosphate synthase [Myxococcales bacterium]|nr:MAG: 3,4-dihydroxy-2-butanone-4-phosphate synthase [Myxococcales bacterium]